MKEHQTAAIKLDSREECTLVPVPPLAASHFAPSSVRLELYSVPPIEFDEIEFHSYVVSLRVSGSPVVEREVSGSLGRKWHRLQEPGGVYIVPPGAYLPLRTFETKQHMLLELSPEVMARAFAELDVDRVEILKQRGVYDDQTKHILLSLKAELETGCLNGPLYADFLGVSLALHMLKSYSVTPLVFREFKGGLSPVKLTTIKDFIEQTLERNASLDEMAKLLGMGTYYFARAFKQSTGLAPHQYILGRRIVNARNLLQTTDLPLAEIAVRLGFSSQSHFTSSFHAHVGVTPKRHRFMQRNKRILAA